MASLKGQCPRCDRVEVWTFSQVDSVRYPPTGGDYEWAEVGAKTTCPACDCPISARVEVNLETHNVVSIVSSRVSPDSELD